MRVSKKYHVSKTKDKVSYEELESQVKKLLNIKSNIDEKQNLLELGLSSLQMMRLISTWKKSEFKIKFTDVISNPTLENWLKILNESSINEDENIYLEKDEVNMYDPFPLTDVQYAYWIGRGENQYLGGVGCHGYMEIDGINVDKIKLEDAFQKVINHHPMLRVKYLKDGKQQIMKKSFLTEVIVNDFRAYDDSEIEKKLKSIRKKLSHRLLNIENGEVLGLQLSLLPNNKTRMHFDIDLLVADVQSFQIILRDLAAAYNRDESPRAPIEWNFAEYINIENKKIKIEKQKAKKYWNDRLKTIFKGPKLPLKNNLNNITKTVFNRREHLFSSEEFSKLKKFSAENKVTVAMVLLTAYTNAIKKWSANKNFLMNIPLFDRKPSIKGIDDVVADFTNILLLEVKTDENDSFLAQVKKIQNQFHEDMNYTAYSGIELQRELVRINPGEKVFAPVVFSCNLGVPLINNEFKECFGKINYMISQTPQVWLDFQLFDMDGGLLCIWDAVEELFPNGFLDELFDLFKNNIIWLLDNKKNWNVNFNIESQSQKVRKNKLKSIEFQEESQCLHTKIFDIARKDPDKIALIDGLNNSKITYGEITKKALEIANKLKNDGVNLGDNVAVSMERGKEQIEAILGVMAAGGCYVPISLNQPEIRLKYIIDKANISYIITSKKYNEKFINEDKINITFFEDIKSECYFKEIKEVSPDQSAYIIFTSGSTGEPKGVEISHKAAFNTIKEINKKYSINENDRVLSVSGFDFDLSVYDIFGLLNVGGSIVLISEEIRRSANYWLDIALRNNVTVWNSVPILLNMLLIEAESRFIKSNYLRVVMLSGDWIGLDIPERLNKFAPNSRLVAMGGATEASIWSNYFDVKLPLNKDWVSIPYGKPLKNQFYRIVDSKGNDCPNWVPGELWIGGAGLAKGYIGDKKLTEEKFIIDNGFRWYKTGDLGRYLGNGNIEFLGRKDYQVKIRGHRIELGEIETVINSNPNIEKAVVSAVENSSGNKSLVGYVVCKDSNELHESKLINKEISRNTWKNVIECKTEIGESEEFIDNYNQYQVICKNITIQYICEMLKNLNVHYTKNDRYSKEYLINKICSKYKSLVKQWVNKLIENKIICEQDDYLVNLCDFPNIDYDIEFGVWKNQIYELKSFLGVFLENSKSLLEGEKDAMQLILSDKYKSPDKFMMNLPGVKYKIAQTKEILKTILNDYDINRPLRILEIGSRSLESSKEFLDIISNRNIEYVCTDSSKYFIEEAKLVYKEYPFIQYRKLDINKDICKQGFIENYYDIVIANSSLHRALNLNKTKDYIAKLLVSRGILLILEMTDNTPLQLISTSFFEDGFTNFKDERKVSCNPLISCEGWGQLLKKGDFEEVRVFPDEKDKLQIFNQNIIVTRVKAKENRVFNQEKLINFVKEKLPEYMVPSKIIELNEIPITSNGKVNRNALPKPIFEKNIILNKKIVEPKTEVEKSLAKVWGEILKIENIGLEDDYFMLGGDSLLATQLNSLIREEFNIDMTLEIIFKKSIFSEMAKHIELLIKKNKKNLLLPKLIPDKENINKPFPLTEVQQSYWIGRSGVYALGDVSTHCYFEMDCKYLDIDRLTFAWNKLIKKHGMMRAVILKDGESQQILESVPEYKIRKYHFKDMLEGDILNKLKEVRGKMENQKFDTSKWPLFDIRASIIDDKQVILHISFDNIIFDGWSMFYLFKEWKNEYENPEKSIEDLEISFRDYIMTYEKIKEGDLYKRDVEYWNNKLERIYKAPDLPLCKRPELLDRQVFYRNEERLSKKEWQDLKNIASENGLTTAGLLITAYAETLARWSRTHKFTINLTRFNRVPFHKQVKDLVGDFTSLTLLSIDMSKGATFLDRAKNIQEELWSDLEHSYVSGVYVERELEKRANLQGGGGMPIVFTSGLGLEEKGNNEKEYLGDINYGLSQTPQVWLDHQVSEQNGGLLLVWDSIEEIFPQDMIKNMFNSYVNLLKDISNNKYLLNDNKTNLVKVKIEGIEENSNYIESPISKETLISLFEKQVKLYPNNEAIITMNKSFTYKEVNNLANYVASNLIKRDVKSNSLVGIVMNKGFEQIIAALGVLKAGAAYLPIDINNPLERVGKILEDGEVKNIIVQKKSHELKGVLDKYNKIILDGNLKYEDEYEINKKPLPVDLAYVIYTSGSTGAPKGVMIDHKGAVNTILDINKRLKVTKDDRTIALSSLGFDLSVYDIFGMLSVGGGIVIPSIEGEKDPKHWVDLIKYKKVSVWNTVPTFMQMLVEYLKSERIPELNSLKSVLLSGDWIPLDLPDKIKEIFRLCKVFGLGGATEASIWSNIFEINNVNSKWRSIPYGKPLKNQHYYILNDLMEPCPNYVPGNMYIGGIGVAKGYWKNEKLTREKFIRHPITNERIYSTGDLGQYMQDGNIEFIGRKDNQVKLRGYRIELGEIEYHLKRLNYIKEIVVEIINNNGNKSLIAYAVKNNSSYDFNLDECKEELRAMLPEYMIPGKFVFLDKFPLTSNGKIDRNKLKDIVPKEESTNKQIVKPFSEIQKRVAKIWSEVLKYQVLSVYDDFFECGGDSLKAIKFVNRLKENFNIDVSLKDFFDKSKIIFVSDMIEKELLESDEGEL
ncbi:amino acid adenylation domain-containing protein [Clostridium sporogenes]|uniref:non-ribosomal peptide synthetase n=1 Tax=Clostridium sp. LCP25S3_F10 TaxID=3438750 RepID=UPI0013D00E2D|nr:amino acid adenylation domain-containing protein [Clostridium sporogenes]NFS25371.1 amino acid adenylation domain-containing protein [Clostridium sporogenes]